VQDEQIAWLREKGDKPYHIMWCDPTDPKKTQHAVIGFSEPRPHIIFIAISNPHEYDLGIVEKDIRTLAIKDFTVLMKVEIPPELLDPTPITL
jgi:hypothetical protein